MEYLKPILLAIIFVVLMGFILVIIPLHPNNVAEKAKEQQREQKKVAATQAVLPGQKAAPREKIALTEEVIAREHFEGSGIAKNDRERRTLSRIGDIGCLSGYSGQKFWSNGRYCWERAEMPPLLQEFIFEGKKVEPGDLLAYKKHVVTQSKTSGTVEIHDYPNLGIACLVSVGQMIKCWDRGEIPPAIAASLPSTANQEQRQ